MRWYNIHNPNRARGQCGSKASKEGIHIHYITYRCSSQLCAKSMLVICDSSSGVYLLQRQKISAFLIFLQPLYWWTRDYKVPSWTKQSIYFNKICSIWKKKKLISIFREWEREEGHAGQVSGLLYEVWGIKQWEQWTRSNDWAGKACLWVPSEATKAGMPLSKASWIWASCESLAANDRVKMSLCSMYPPKLATYIWKQQSTTRVSR